MNRALGTFAFVLSCFAFSCGKSKPSETEIVVGAFLSETGGDATFGKDTRSGIELAVDEVNKAGGVRGKKVKVIYEDDKSNPTEASNKVRQLIDRDKVIAILGEVASSRSLAGGAIAQQKKIPMVTPSSTAVEVTKGRDFVFRACFTDEQQGDVAARFVAETLKKKKAAILFAAQDDYSAGLARTFRTHFTKAGGEIVIEKGFQNNETNFATYMDQIKTANPEVIFAPVYYKEMANIAREAKRNGMPGSMFVGSDGWDSPDLLAATKAQRKLFFNLRSMKASLAQDVDSRQGFNTLGPEEVKAVARQLGVKPEEVIEMETRLTGADVSLEPLSDDDEDSYAPIAYLAADKNAEPSAIIERKEYDRLQDEGLRTALAALDDRSRDIVQRRWLVADGEEAATLHELAAEYGISAERIRQIEVKAMQKMKTRLLAA